ncbi:MAG: NADH-quinone oxidoreductase subunit NuoG [Pseudomonadota bacterium]
MTDTVKLTIDGVEIEVDKRLTLLQACELAGAEVPRFCFHDRLTIAGNCRMCLVQVEKAPKPVASCAQPVADGMVVHTRGDVAGGAQRGAMEFLLINHPLDCPICDQGGECDLQDQAMGYGLGISRFHEHKRSVQEKEFGPLIKTYMTRCIHCTRCIRFMDEIAGVPSLGATGRGEDMEITTYIENGINSELSGNVIDLCPVGALTSKPYAFVARPWELKKTDSVDVLDGVGSNIRVDARGREVLRVLPRLHEDINEEWLSDKSRFAVDGLMRRRLDTPYVRKAGKLEPVSWEEALQAAADKLNRTDGAKIAALAGDQVDCEAMTALLALLDQKGSPHRDCRLDGMKVDPAVRTSYLFNTTIAGIEQADACLIVGANPRKEAALINARLRKRWLMGGFEVGVVGPQVDLTYPSSYLGAGPRTLQEIAEGSSTFAGVLKRAERPMIIVGAGALARDDGAAVLALVRQIAEASGAGSDDWNGVNVLHTAASRVGGLDLGFVPGEGGRDTAGILAGAEDGAIEVVYLLDADGPGIERLANSFVIYQGHHGDHGARVADIILPGAAYTEKDAIYVNMEGRPQQAARAVFPPGEAREDWKIIRALSGAMGAAVPMDTIDDVRTRMFEIAPHLGASDEIVAAAWQAFGTAGTLDDTAFSAAVDNFYMTCPISRASPTMAQCTEAFVNASGEATGTDG